MLFNSTVYQIGGGTHTIISVNISTNSSNSYEIPDEATMFCFGGWCNGTCVYIATRGADKKFHVEVNRMTSDSSVLPGVGEGDWWIINNFGTSGPLTGTLIYK